MTHRAKWTFLVYMASAKNLPAAGTRDLEAMRKAGSSDAVNIVAQLDQGGTKGVTERYHIQRAGVDQPVEPLGTTDCGDPNVLLDFIDSTAKRFPAEHYALILWGHGSSWAPSDIDRIATEVKAIDYRKGEGAKRAATRLGRAFFRHTLEEVLRQPTVIERDICSDDGTLHSLDTVELGKVLTEAEAILKQPIDLLGMDACLMGNLEVMCQARPFVRYAVASENDEPKDGWPYNAILRPLVKNPDMAPAELATLIVQAYLKYYQSRPGAWPVTMTALDLSRLEDVLAPAGKLSDALIAAMPLAKRGINSALYYCQTFWDGTLFDVVEFCTHLQGQVADPAVFQASQDVCSALQVGSGRLVMAKDSLGPELDGCGGLSIYLPERKEDMRVSPSYAALEFAQNYRWLDMLKTFHRKRA